MPWCKIIAISSYTQLEFTPKMYPCKNGDEMCETCQVGKKIWHCFTHTDILESTCDKGARLSNKKSPTTHTTIGQPQLLHVYIFFHCIRPIVKL